MTRANVARRQGDDFQARTFWLNAACLLDPQRSVVRVAYETGPKSFDDILVEYDPARPHLNHDGSPLVRKHIQSKWHTTAGTFGYEDLVDPAFINAERHSLLHRAREARSQGGADGNGRRLEFKTNWRLRDKDPLLDLVGKGSDAINVDGLFDGTTDRSRMGQVRKLWRDHLGASDDELRSVVHALSIAETSESLNALRERLDERFAYVGMKRVPPNQSSFLYDDLIVKLHAQGRIDFDRESFRLMCEREGLLTQAADPRPPVTIGVRSFMHPIDALEDRCNKILNLVPHFEGRYIRRAEDWQAKILPELRDFLLSAARGVDQLRLVVDAHTSLAFAVGALLNVKSGKRIEIEQRTGSRRFWSMDDEPIDANWSRLAVTEDRFRDEQPDIAVSVSLTHDVSPAARAYVTSQLASVGRIVHFTPEGGPSQQSVKCGRHAWTLAESVNAHLQSLRNGGGSFRRAHLFIAGPNGFTFFLGQFQQAIGPVTVYEWDFERQRGGGYSPGPSIAA